MQTVYELAERYYPELWNKQRLNALVAAEKITKTQVNKITKAKEEITKEEYQAMTFEAENTTEV